MYSFNINKLYYAKHHSGVTTQQEQDRVEHVKAYVWVRAIRKGWGQRNADRKKDKTRHIEEVQV